MQNILANLASAARQLLPSRKAHTNATFKPEFIEPFLLKVAAELPLSISKKQLFDLTERATERKASYCTTKLVFNNTTTSIDCRTQHEGDLIQLHFYSPNEELIKMISAEMDEFCAVQAGVKLNRPLHAQQPQAMLNHAA